MANRAPLVLAAGRRQQLQKADVLAYQIDVATDVPRLLLQVTDNSGLEAFSIRASQNAVTPNLFMGTNHGASAITGTGNVGICRGALASLTGGIGNWCVGPGAGGAITSGNNNFCAGPSAGDSITTAIQNFCFGPSAGGSITVTNSNVCIGSSSYVNGTGSNCFCLGTNSGASLLNASNNIFIGSNAGNNASQSTTSSGSILIGGTTWSGGNNSIVIGVGATAAGSNAIAMGAGIAVAANQAIFGTTNITQTLVRGTLDVVRSTNACRVNAYNTAAADPPGTSYELVTMRWASNIARLETEKGSGGGTARALALGTDGTSRFTIGSAGDFTISDGEDFIFDTTTGSKIGTATGQKIGFWNATPIIQPAAANQAALTNSTGGAYNGTLVAISGTAQDANLNDNFTDLHTLLNEIRTALVNSGLMKGAA